MAIETTFQTNLLDGTGSAPVLAIERWEPGNAPDNFAAYIAANPEALGNYDDFAAIVIQRVSETHQDSLLALSGPYGTGKTRLLIPSLRKTAAQRGMHALGSIGGFNNGISHIHLNPDNRLTGESKTMPEAAEVYSTSKKDMDAVKSEIEATFAGSDGRGLYIIDEFGYFSESQPELLAFISQEAQANNVKLIAVTPVVDPADASLEDRRSILSETYALHAALSEATGKIIVPVSIPENLVDTRVVADILATYGIDPNTLKAFEDNPHLRRIRVLEELVDGLFSARKHIWPANQSLLTQADLRILYAVQAKDAFIDRTTGLAGRAMTEEILEERAAGSGMTLGAYSIMLSGLFDGTPLKIT